MDPVSQGYSHVAAPANTESGGTDMALDRRTFLEGILIGGSVAGVSAASGTASANEASAAATFTDLTYNEPYIYKDEWRDAPVRHRYVHGGFVGTDARFSFYFPPKDRYQGRFFQLITPVPLSENSSEGATGEADYIGFAIDSGAYFVRTNQGGLAATGSPGSPVDPTIAGYRVSAAGAEYSRVLAMQMYDGKRPYGYAFGGSGGSYRTIAGFENTQAWDGAVPFVMPTPHAVPTMFTVRLHALRLVGEKFAQVVDAVEPGGSGDIYAGLNEDEREGLREATRMGFPPRTWFLYKSMGWGPFSNVYDLVVKNDPTYTEDFWKVPGYLGANPPESLKRARVQLKTRVKRVITTEDAAAAGLRPPSQAYSGSTGDLATAWRNYQNQWGSRAFPVAFELESVPSDVSNLEGAGIIIQPAAGAAGRVSVGGVHGDILSILFTPVSGTQASITSSVRIGDEVTIDNSDVLAMQTYHRHCVPPPEFYGWNQFRGPDGKALLPQRPRLIGPMFAVAAGGALQTGRFRGKMIVVQSMMDEDALPWNADWYRSKVREHLGVRFHENYRIYFTDCALHVSDVTQASPTRTVSYRGTLHQALRDLSAWVEHGVSPPESTNYRVDDAQVLLPPTAADRKGIQLVVALTANGKPRADVRVGQAVEFVGVLEAPPKAGAVVAAEWDFDGSGNYGTSNEFTPAQRVEVHRSHSFSAPGTYFVTLRGASQRRGDASTPYARIYNLARTRVVVT
jgi:hypothetical protein